MLSTGVMVSLVFEVHNTAGGTVGNASPQANWPRRISSQAMSSGRT
jgi:hypothetical protein